MKGAAYGMPGLMTSRSCPSSSGSAGCPSRRSTGSACSSCASASFSSGLESLAVTCAPSRHSSPAAATPLRASPTTSARLSFHCKDNTSKKTRATPAGRSKAQATLKMASRHSATVTSVYIVTIFGSGMPHSSKWW